MEFNLLVELGIDLTVARGTVTGASCGLSSSTAASPSPAWGRPTSAMVRQRPCAQLYVNRRIGTAVVPQPSRRQAGDCDIGIGQGLILGFCIRAKSARFSGTRGLQWQHRLAQLNRIQDSSAHTGASSPIGA
jgi:hypothetical protein